MNIVKLKNIVAVDRMGSITAAAQAQNLSQSAITKNVAEIEQMLGIKIFERHARGVITTESGRAFIDRAKRIIHDFDQLLEETSSEGRKTAHLVRLTVAPPSIEVLANRMIAEFVKHNPAAHLHLKPATIDHGIRMLRRGDIDILIGDAFLLSMEPAFAIQQIGVLNTKLFARKGHPLAGLSKVKTEQLMEYPLIMSDPFNSSVNPLTSRLMGQGGMDSYNLHVVENFGLVTSIVTNSDSIGPVSAKFTESKHFKERYAVIDPSYEAPINMAYATLARHQHNLIVRKMLATIEACPPF